MPENPTSSSLSAAKTQLSDIPASVVFYEILPRLPDKYIARFKSVSKEWYKTISTTHFIKTHYRLLSSSPRSVLAINNQQDFSIFDFGDFPDLHVIKVGKLFTNNNIATYLVDSCNGVAFLICCSNRKSDNQNLKLPNDLLHFDYHFVIFNPVLGRIPYIQINHPPQFLVSNSNNIVAQDYNFGVGYVSSVNDYYIVAINFLRNPEIAVMHLYSFRTREWRRKEESNKRFTSKFEEVWYNKSGILVNEVLHWGISISFQIGEIQIESYAIGVLDLAHFGNNLNQVEFKIMRLPQNNFREARTEGGGSGFSLCSLNGCLCAWGMYNGKKLDMWMMKKYGVHESWTRLFGLNLTDFCGDGITNFYGLNKYEMAMILTYNFELVLGRCNRDPPSHMHCDYMNQVMAVNYTRSLVSPLALISIGAKRIY